MFKFLKELLDLIRCYNKWLWYKKMQLRADVFLPIIVSDINKKYPNSKKGRNLIAKLIKKSRCYIVNEHYVKNKKIYLEHFANKNIILNGEAKIGEYYKVISINSPSKGKRYNSYINEIFTNGNAIPWVEYRWKGDNINSFKDFRCPPNNPYIISYGRIGNWFDNGNVGDVFVAEYIERKNDSHIYDIISQGKNKFMVDCIRLVRATDDEINEYLMQEYLNEITPTLRTLNHE